jgi:hypothetical protein
MCYQLWNGGGGAAVKSVLCLHKQQAGSTNLNYLKVFSIVCVLLCILIGGQNVKIFSDSQHHVHIQTEVFPQYVFFYYMQGGQKYKYKCHTHKNGHIQGSRNSDFQL